MGYSYGQNERGTWVLACDNCGHAGGCRKVECVHKVLGDSLRTVNRQRHEMAYCPAPALCADCRVTLGPPSKLHERCAEGARASQARYDEIERGLDAGESYVTSAAGDWADGVPAGMVRVTFNGRAGETVRLVPAGDYQPGAKPRLSDYDHVAVAA